MITIQAEQITTQKEAFVAGFFGWTDMKHGSLSQAPELEFDKKDHFFVENIQVLSDRVKSLGHQLIYDDSNNCHWCIADADGKIVSRNYGLSKAVSRLEQQSL